MRYFILLLVSFLLYEQVEPGPQNDLQYQENARKFIEDAEKEMQEDAIKSTFDAWNYESNITDETEAVYTKSQEESSALTNRLGKEAQNYEISKIQDYDVKRKLKLMKNIGTSILPRDKLKSFIKLTTDMSKTYSTAKVLDYRTKTEKFSLEPELTEILSRSRDPAELKYYWEQWRASSGQNIREMYGQYVDLYNEAADLNGFEDASRMKVDSYESDTFMEEMAETWEGLKPLYQELHAYVRHKLNGFYGPEVVADSGAIPAHLLGNMWAQSWNNIADILKPFPAKPSINVTGAMVEQGWDQTKMFQKADEFFQSMGLPAMPGKFWAGSIIKKPEDGRELTCHASAWDFYNGEDFRIKQCTRVTQEDFITVNHEMGHVQYFLQYKDKSYLYRNGANPGFHEGVADILSLAVGTATYFQRLGLLDENLDVNDEQTNINILFDMALERIAFLPFGYLVDKFRWDVYSGVTSRENMNCHWWKLRKEIQGLAPPSTRNNQQFDAGAKYHVAGDVGYVRYFTAFIYEFQFYRQLCLESGKYEPGNPKKPLHQCNFYGSVEAGNKMKEMLSLGSSRPWREAMQKMTGQRKMSTKAIREYFAPLESWLKEENRKTGVTVGWGETDVDSMCQQTLGSTKERENSHWLKGQDLASGALTVTGGTFLVVIQLVLVRTFSC